MKFSSVLGTFALSTLEAYRAHASPLDAVSPETQSLNGRDGGACCVIVGKRGYAVTYTGESNVLVTIHGQCKVFVDQIASPSSSGCLQWRVSRQGCSGPNDARVMSMDFCS
ncbi:hypothetical protein E4U10_007386 [Claviceps purpurea]|nr:hypothetical protein E4U12_003673 [Claviceps purpurea]KAG6166183.1 hypothetical protein E4U51_003788 [Claviceps purpurea]KAG6198133.1 hypothetical protein E4U10_007386 [Claviceps purpurea]KAG6206491.1 hypothetical protein E4U50_004201 [Claviceps purpurea]